MAVEPLYNADRDTLLKRVRIETADDEQTVALINQTINEVRLGFYRKLTSARATTIAGYSLVENPTTDEQILRATGANTEALWVTWLLAQRLPYLFMDNRSSVGDAFNDEQLTRDSSGLADFLEALKAQIDEGLGAMAEPAIDDSGMIKAASITNDEAFDPFDSYRGLYPLGDNYLVSGGL